MYTNSGCDCTVKLPAITYIIIVYRIAKNFHLFHLLLSWAKILSHNFFCPVDEFYSMKYFCNARVHVGGLGKNFFSSENFPLYCCSDLFYHV